MTRNFGIDLGTTNSLIATMEGGQPEVIADPVSGRFLLPSVIALSPQGMIAVGDEAIAIESRMIEDKNDRAGGGLAAPCVVVRSVKSYMGVGGDEVAAQERMRYEFADLSGPVVRFKAGKRGYTPSEISAEILRTLKTWGQAAYGEPVEKVVITVPAYFNDAQRQATKDAGRLAGLEVLRLVNEPTAASLAYGLNRLAAGRIAVYDLGGGTFDISILSVKEGLFEVLATNGDTHLGGDDIDKLLVEFILDGAAPSSGFERRLWNAARTKAEEAKKLLTTADSTDITLRLEDRAINKAIRREELERMAEGLIERTLVRCRLALKDASLEPEEIDAVVLVGGATRMPLVRRRVAEMFGREPLCSLDPDQVVAMGAAVQAGVLMGAQSDLLLLDVVPLSLGIETMGGVMERLVHRNTTIPTSVKEMFTTAVDNQTHIDVHVLQGERELATDCRSLARFKLGPIAAQPAGVPRIEVTFLIDANGILNVTACDQRTGREHSVDVKPSYGLTDEEIERMLEESIDLGEEDLERRLLIVARNDAEQIQTALDKQLREYSELIDPLERREIEAMAERLGQAQVGTDRELIARLVEELNELTTPFAQRIMDYSIKRALEKKSVEEVS